MNQTTIAGYRSFAGKPRRGSLAPARSSQRLVERIRKRTAELACQSKAGLLHQKDNLQKRIQKRMESAESITSTAIVCESFALTTEALRRATGMVYYDVQLIGGLALAAGTVAEIQTGEGKTITTGLPAVLHALTGKGVHVSTTNEYLSRRDHDELQPVFLQLGLTSGILEPQAAVPKKIEAYACDITYGPGYEFGFDFLRDQLSIRNRYRERLGERFMRSLQGIVCSEEPLTQRGHYFAVVDEADSVLIDEANTPLIMSGGQMGIATAPALFLFANDVASRLSEDEHFYIDQQKRSVEFTDAGWQTLHQAFETRPPGRLARQWSTLVQNALRAVHILQLDEDYVIKDDKIMIVDQNTGRIHDERTWNSGLHQAVEAKERVPLTRENETQARITRQRFCGFYEKMCGLTGTAAGGENEFRQFYDMPVVRIATNKPCQRKSWRLRSFANAKSKMQAIVREAVAQSQAARPVLIGTRTIRESKQLHDLLTQQQVAHVVLNGMQNEEEAAIVSRAGRAGAITIATNMAGRGTDIRLDEHAKAAGGLHVIATEYHHSQRVDRQLAGRAARQGDPGSCRFFAAADDALISNNHPGLAQRMQETADADGECKTDYTADIHRVQMQVQEQAAVQRQSMVDHDKWLESVQSALARREAS